MLGYHLHFKISQHTKKQMKCYGCPNKMAVKIKFPTCKITAVVGIANIKHPFARRQTQEHVPHHTMKFFIHVQLPLILFFPFGKWYISQESHG